MLLQNLGRFTERYKDLSQSFLFISLDKNLKILKCRKIDFIKFFHQLNIYRKLNYSFLVKKTHREARNYDEILLNSNLDVSNRQYLNPSYPDFKSIYQNSTFSSFLNCNRDTIVITRHHKKQNFAYPISFSTLPLSFFYIESEFSFKTQRCCLYYAKSHCSIRYFSFSNSYKDYNYYDKFPERAIIRNSQWKPMENDAKNDSNTISHPQFMNGGSLAMYACLAARQSANDVIWNSIISRAKELLYSLEPKDIAMILNSLAKCRKSDDQLFLDLIPIITSRLTYYKSLYLAMIISAYAKANLYNEDFISSILDTLKSRYFEFQSPVELSMVMNALAKLKVYNRGIFELFASHIKSRMCLELFHIRELSVIVYAYAKVNHIDNHLFDYIAQQSLATISEATPLEFSRIFHAFFKVGRFASDVFEIAINLIIERLIFMSPNELTNVAFAFGKVAEVGENQFPLLDTLFKKIRQCVIGILPLFSFQEMSSFLCTYSRWKISFDLRDLSVIVDHLTKNYDTSKVSPSTFVHLIYSISLLVKYNLKNLNSFPNFYKKSANSDDFTIQETIASKFSEELYVLQRIHKFFILVIPTISRALLKPDIDIFQITRIVESFCICKLASGKLEEIVRDALLTRFNEFDSYSATLIFDNMKSLGLLTNVDLMELLQDRIKNAQTFRKIENTLVTVDDDEIYR